MYFPLLQHLLAPNPKKLCSQLALHCLPHPLAAEPTNTATLAHQQVIQLFCAKHLPSALCRSCHEAPQRLQQCNALAPAAGSCTQQSSTGDKAARGTRVSMLQGKLRHRDRAILRWGSANNDASGRRWEHMCVRSTNHAIRNQSE